MSVSKIHHPAARLNHTAIYPLRRAGAIILWLLIALVLGACASTSGPTSPVPEMPQIPADSTAALLRQAAQAPPDQAAVLYLSAAWAFFDEGNLPAATQASNAVDSKRLAAADRNRHQLLLAELAIARGDDAEADRLLATLAFDPVNARTAARICAAQRDFICAANQLIASSSDDASRNDLIWRYLGLAPGASVNAQSHAQQGVARGWWQLKLAMLKSHSPDERLRAFDFWRKAWPEHPASLAPPRSLQATLSDASPPAQIGLLLPLSGPLALAGDAVRNGVISAYLEQRELSDVTVNFYDTEATPLPLLYEQALNDGVEVLIGPLRKERVTEINDLNPQIPVLALNYLDQELPAAPGLLQLGLAIEDESTSIVQALAAIGVDSLLVFHNFEDWSLRARRQLTALWSDRITVQAFTDVRTITEAVGTAMDVGDSNDRHETLDKLFSEDLEFLPRARQDIGAVVALVDNVEANALVPALQFHFADHLPVFACSQVVRGARRDQLMELDGFKVTELPWLLSDDPLFQAMDGPFGLTGNRFASLSALGIDALRMALMFKLLERDNTSVMLGSTGVLALYDDGRFHRDLTLGVVRDGRVGRATGSEATSD